MDRIRSGTGTRVLWAGLLPITSGHRFRTERVFWLGLRWWLPAARMLLLALICAACPIKAAAALPPIGAALRIANVSTKGRSLFVPVTLTLCIHYDEGDRWFEESCDSPDQVCVPNTQGYRRPDGGLQRTMCVWSAKKLEELRRQSEEDSRRAYEEGRQKTLRAFQQSFREAVKKVEPQLPQAQKAFESKDYLTAFAIFNQAELAYRQAGQKEKAQWAKRMADLADCRSKIQTLDKPDFIHHQPWVNYVKGRCEGFQPELKEIQTRIDGINEQKVQTKPAGEEIAKPEINPHGAAQPHIKTPLPSMPSPAHDAGAGGVKPAGEEIAKLEINPHGTAQPHIRTGLPSIPPPQHDGNAAGTKPAGEEIAKPEANPRGTAQSHIKTSLPGAAKSPTGGVVSKEATCNGEFTSEGCIPVQTGKPNGPISVFVGGQSVQSQPQQIKLPGTSGPVNRPGYECKEWNATLTACTGGWMQRFSIGDAPPKRQELLTQSHNAAQPLQLQNPLGRFGAIPLPDNRVADNGPGSPPSQIHRCSDGQAWGGPQTHCKPCSEISQLAWSPEDQKSCAKKPVPAPQGLGCTCPAGAQIVELHLSAKQLELDELYTKGGNPPPPPCELSGGKWNTGPTVTWTELDGTRHDIPRGSGIYTLNGTFIVAEKGNCQKGSCPPGKYPDDAEPLGESMVRNNTGGHCVTPMSVQGDWNPAFNGWLSLGCAMWRDRLVHNHTDACPTPPPSKALAPSASKQ
jgi:hypothetical protein